MKQLRVIAALCAILGLGVAVAGCGGGVPAGAVATVDGEAIDQGTFEHWMAVTAKSSGRVNAEVPKPPHYAACVAQKRKAQAAASQEKVPEAQLKQQCEQEYGVLRDQVLRLLLSSRWLEGEAKERGISVDDAEVARAFEQSFPQDTDLRQVFEQSGQTEQDLLTRVRLDLLANKIREQVTKGEAKPTDRQIADYYDTNKARFAQPQRRDLRIVLTKTAGKAERARAALARGASWKTVAKAYSIDESSKSQGGTLLAMTKGQQQKALDDAVFGARRGKLTGPVKTRLGYYVFEVTNVMRAEQQTLEQATPTIKQLLVSEGQREPLVEFTEKFRDKWRAKTECREGYVTPDCKNGPKAAPTPAEQAAGAQPAAPQP